MRVGGRLRRDVGDRAADGPDLEEVRRTRFDERGRLGGERRREVRHEPGARHRLALPPVRRRIEGHPDDLVVAGELRRLVDERADPSRRG